MGTYETNLMPVSHEIKSQLAKLLATEDLVVEHRHIDTAQFNVHTRVLTLPLWEKASNTVYDMLVGHEVGHALFTPDQDPPKNIPHQFVNIVEDARIEKLMKRKYMGLAKTFFNGYKELSDEDFFCLEDEDVSKMNLADRANLYFKIGNHIDISFTEEEMAIIRIIDGCEDFDDVLLAAEVLYKYCKKEKEKEKAPEEMQPQQSTQEGGGSAQGMSGEEQQDNANENTNEEGNTNEGSSIGNSSDKKQSTSGSQDDEPEVNTADNFDEKLKELVSSYANDNVYVELPKLNLDTVIANNKEVHNVIDSFFNNQQKRFDEISREKEIETQNVYSKVDQEFYKFKKSAGKEVSYLVKEFECKKSADAYARSTTARTGVLDCSKLHTYKYNEDIFRTVNVIPDGKNHGLVFVLDWSGSMSMVIKDTCRQLFNLVWFCKKVSIPFEVYAFTNEWVRPTYDYENEKYIAQDLKPHYEKKEGILHVGEDFTMMNILSSKVSSKELDNQLVNVWRIASYFSSQWGTGYAIPDKLSLSGTPLNEALVTLHQIIPSFKKENKLQKVQCIVLTDGEANHLVRHVEVKRDWDKEPYIGTRRLDPGTTFVRDRKLGTTYKVDYEWHKFTDLLLRNLKENFPNTNFIGIRVLSPRDANHFIKMYYEYGVDLEKVQKEWKTERSFCIKKSGYDAYFGMSATTLSQDVDFDVKEDATKSQIKSAFAKSLKTKKLNKKVLGEFISLVA